MNRGGTGRRERHLLSASHRHTPGHTVSLHYHQGGSKGRNFNSRSTSYDADSVRGSPIEKRVVRAIENLPKVENDEKTLQCQTLPGTSSPVRDQVFNGVSELGFGGRRSEL